VTRACITNECRGVVQPGRDSCAACIRSRCQRSIVSRRTVERERRLTQVTTFQPQTGAFRVQRTPREAKRQEPEIISLKKQGLSQSQIAAEFDLSIGAISGTVRRWRLKNGVPAQPCSPGPPQIYAERDAEIMRVREAEKLTKGPLAERFSMTIGAISSVIRRWRIRNGDPTSSR